MYVPGSAMFSSNNRANTCFLLGSLAFSIQFTIPLCPNNNSSILCVYSFMVCPVCVWLGGFYLLPISWP
ncbi:hypothetical protein BDW74DRAFT_149662 [Aspergillus multicolor]|uniref:uncharacterized protein n=1 Tax=Aspergillus multicolor TaxID=41759 RepID=UPI003CCD0FA9